MGAEFFHADGRTGMTKPIVAFRNFAKVPKNTHVHFDKNGINLQYWKQLVESYVR